MTTDREKHAVTAWQTAITVQQHFNTLEMQIRNLAISVLTATVGTAAVVYSRNQDAIAKAISEGKTPPEFSSVEVLGFITLSPSDLIVIAGLVAWGAFYFMDRWWYHRLLQGAVTHARSIEESWEQTLPELRLSRTIRDGSKVKFLWRFEIHSDNKIDIFYGLVAVIIFLLLFVF